MNACARGRLVVAVAVAAGTCGMATSVLGQATFQPLGDSVEPVRKSDAWSVSGDGNAVVGWVQADGIGALQLPARWPVAGSPPEVLTDRDGQSIHGAARGASRSGTVVVGDVSSGSRWGFAWIGSTVEWLLFARIAGVSSDGELMCGQRGPLSAVWRSGEEPTYLPLPAGFEVSEVTAISGTGDFVAGYVQHLQGPVPVETRAVVWRRDGASYMPMVLPAGKSDSLAYSISPDGTVVVGFHSGGAAWRRGEGPLPITAEVNGFVGVLDVSRRGARMVGGVGSTSNKRAWLWDAHGDSWNLKELLEKVHGLDLTGWILSSANGISDDGTVIVGSGTNPQGRPQGWRVVLPLPCASDWNFDGVVNSTDVSDFINEWFADQEDGATLASDVDGNGVVNSTDVSEYINAWFKDVESCG